MTAVRQVYRALGLVAALAASLASFRTFASSDPLIDALPVGGTGFGFAWRQVRSPYKGSPTTADNLPLYLYEGERAYLHATRLGLKFTSEDWRFDAFVSYRFEGFNVDNVPTSMTGLGVREPGWDAGVSLRRRMDWGTPYVEALHDVTKSSDGTELRAGYWNEWRSGRLKLKPHVMLGWRNASLNNHYYGTPTYQAGAGLDAHAALHARYALTESWNLIGAIAATRRSSEITSSPVVQSGLESEAFLGVLYDFKPKQARWAPQSKPLIVKAL